jgi:peptidoglycan glycosyltransferase
MDKQLDRLTVAFASAFALVALALGYWGVTREAALTARPDNPRRALVERRVPRGRILDQAGRALAETTGAPGAYTRAYPFPDLAPVLGYVLPLYGSAGLEAALDGVLHGDEGYNALELFWLDTVLGRPPAGRDARLAIDLSWQQRAEAALGERAGAAVVLDAHSGDIVAMASHPTYDANQLEEDWPALIADPGAPLLNRATLGQYQPGGLIYPLVAAGAVADGTATLGQPFNAEALALQVNGTTVECRTAPDGAAVTLLQALEQGCPGPFALLGRRMGTERLRGLFDAAGLFAAPEIGVATAALPDEATVSDAEAAAAGQGTLTVSPLQAALMAAALVNNGAAPAPRLVLETQRRGGEWREAREAAAAGTAAPALPDEAASALRALFAAGYTASAVSGPEGRPLTWEVRLEEGRWVWVVLVEG